jgi:hypothetical protein
MAPPDLEDAAQHTGMTLRSRALPLPRSRPAPRSTHSEKLAAPIASLSNEISSTAPTAGENPLRSGAAGEPQTNTNGSLEVCSFSSTLLDYGGLDHNIDHSRSSEAF